MRVTLGPERRDGWITVHPDPAVEADVHLTVTEFVDEHGEQIRELDLGFLDGPAELVLDRLAGALRPGAVVTGLGAADRVQQEVTDRLERSGLAVVSVTETAAGWAFRAAVPGNPSDRDADAVPDNIENEPRGLVAEEAPASRIPDLLDGDDTATGVEPAGLKARLRIAASERLPQGSRAREIARAGLTTYRELVHTAERIREAWVIPGAVEPKEPSYKAFLRRHDSTPQQLADQRTYSRRVDHPLQVHVVVAEGNDDDLEATLASVRAQSWQQWTVSVLDSSPAGPDRDPRVARRAPDGRPVAERINTAVAESDSDLVVVLRRGDRLRPDCLYHLTASARRDPLVDLITWDDDVCEGPAGLTRHSDPRFRPSWSPETLLGANYVGRSFAMRRARFMAIGGVRPQAGAAIHWDLLLRCGLESERVARIARVLSSVPARRAEPVADAVPTVQEHLDRAGPARRRRAGRPAASASRGNPEWPRGHRRHPDPAQPRDALHLPAARWPPPTTRRSTSSSSTTAAAPTTTSSWYAEHVPRRRRSTCSGGPSRSTTRRSTTRGARASDAARCSSSSTTTPSSPIPAWMREMVGWAVQPGVGVVGRAARRRRRRIQHSRCDPRAHRIRRPHLPGHAPRLVVAVRVDVVVPQCARGHRCVPRGPPERVRATLGGFDERFELMGSDVVLGLDAVNAARATSARRSPACGTSRRRHGAPHIPRNDFFASYWRYQRWVLGGDPYFSPNLSLASLMPTLRSRYEPTPAAADVGATRPGAARVPAVERRRGIDHARQHVPRHRRRRTRRRRRAHREPRRVRREVDQLVPPRHRQPVLRRDQHRAPIADQLARGRRASRTASCSGPRRTTSSSARRSRPRSPSLAGLASRSTTRPRAVDRVPSRRPTSTSRRCGPPRTPSRTRPASRRKFYLIQDFEPMFYPAARCTRSPRRATGWACTASATPSNLRSIYDERVRRQGDVVQPAVDPTVFHAEGRALERTPGTRSTVFVLRAAPGTGGTAGSSRRSRSRSSSGGSATGVRIVTAGSWARATDVGTDIEHLGLLDYRATGELYRHVRRRRRR